MVLREFGAVCRSVVESHSKLAGGEFLGAWGCRFSLHRSRMASSSSQKSGDNTLGWFVFSSIFTSAALSSQDQTGDCRTKALRWNIPDVRGLLENVQYRHF